jgi:hypothetical protein
MVKYIRGKNLRNLWLFLVVRSNAMTIVFSYYTIIYAFLVIIIVDVLKSIIKAEHLTVKGFVYRLLVLILSGIISYVSNDFHFVLADFAVLVVLSSSLYSIGGYKLLRDKLTEVIKGINLRSK